MIVREVTGVTNSDCKGTEELFEIAELCDDSIPASCGVVSMVL